MRDGVVGVEGVEALSSSILLRLMPCFGVAMTGERTRKADGWFSIESILRNCAMCTSLNRPVLPCADLIRRSPVPSAAEESLLHL